MVDYRKMPGADQVRRVAAFALVALAGMVLILGLTMAPASTADYRYHPAVPTGAKCSDKDCHDDSWRHLPPYTGDCGKCHRRSTWSIVIYEHDSPDLDEGIHGVMGCVRCHTEGSPALPKTCTDCHEVKHAGWTKCRACHIPSVWRVRRAAPEGHLSLMGGHFGLSCLDCHTLAESPAVPRTCVDCHGTKHGGLRDCAQCHDPADGWKPRSFDHAVFFPITGRHKRLTCTKCHPRGQFAGTSPACVSCHGRKHGGLSKCSQCHTTSRFKPSTFRHSRVFPLAGGPHASLACSRCHPSNRYAQVAGRSCLGCHGAKHGVSTCGSCHTASGAVVSGFDHSAFFVLQGRHASLPCGSCHASGFSTPGRNCVDCHGTRHGGQTACYSCHTTTSWSPTLSITHPSPVRLGSAHASRPCTLCHPTLQFNAPTTPCQSCHLGDVPHVGPTRCYDCHQPTTWSDWHGKFSHPAITVPGNVHDINSFASCLDSCHDGDFTTYSCTRCH